MSTFTAIKDPQETVSMLIKWTDWLNGDTISASTWTVTGNESPVTLSVSSNAIQSDTTVSPNLSNQWTNATVTSGTSGITYTLTNNVITATGLVGERSITVKVWDV